MNGRDLVRALTFPWCERQVLEHIGTIEGLENIPTHGPFVLAPNHSSYFDHFVVEFLLHAVRGTPTWFLTKRESFEKPLNRVWTEAWYGIPVDRDSPSAGTMRQIQRVLADGHALCVYPEGTRGPGDALLPFKAGAFRFALKGGVPVIPMGMTGTNTVLARGQKLLRNGRVHIAIGAPILPREGESKQRQAEIMAGESRAAIEALAEKAKANAAHQRGDQLGYRGAALVDTLATAGFDDNSRLSAGVISRLEFLVALFRRSAPNNPDLLAQSLRLLGLRALAAPLPLKALLGMRVRSGAVDLLAADPGHKDAHYLLGRWHLASPMFLGSSPAAAVAHFEASAAASAPGDTRALAGLAEAEEAAGNPAAAVEAYRRVLEETPGGHVRAGARVGKVKKQLELLESKG